MILRLLLSSRLTRKRKTLRLSSMACTRKDTLRAQILASPPMVLDENHPLTILPAHSPPHLLMFLSVLSVSLLDFHLETRSRSVVATLIRSGSTRSVVSGHRHCSLVLVAMG